MSPTTSDPERLRIEEACSRLASARTKGELGTLLAREAERYTLVDLQMIGGRLYREVEALPPPYREAVRPFFTEQVLGAYHRLLSMHRAGKFAAMTAPLTDPGQALAYVAMVPEGCFCWDDSGVAGYEPRHRFFYYLVAAFEMFVLDRPGHPVGMPFPGGFSVEERSGRFLCPVRDREKDVPHSLCNFCPAEQSEMP
ncbi:DUF2115 domain-containing protein [Methanoculleus sp. FWC-SCC1]|uniref:UPF0305 protein FGU65_12695 n=1 Tax=Methanoculleus frigidifontis TaxID=2584085 RepID=A0ABT8MCR6_9EURY|nr:DUF2115 domain-containing protein [Methanoculleus sp. FWC-SCC1]MDN7025728.1 DUF2115 domain-containing protein [Methanoculleus sp. FWC-SCC1]